MDTDPAITVDFIFVRVGKSTTKVNPGHHIKLLESKRMGDKEHPSDPTIKGSDHFSIVSEFDILSL
jgi:hypothetical protein